MEGQTTLSLLLSERHHNRTVLRALKNRPVDDDFWNHGVDPDDVFVLVLGEIDHHGMVDCTKLVHLYCLKEKCSSPKREAEIG